MTAPDCDRACGCRAEVERLRNDLADALDLKNGTGPTALSAVVRDRDDARTEIAKMRPVYEATVRWHKAISPSDLSEAYDELYDAVAAALAADSDREVEGE